MTGNDSTVRVGDLLSGRYRVESVIGRGGMAVVYRAQDTDLGRPVAIKVFHSASADGGAIERQRLEVELLATLNHPSLVTLFDTGTEPTSDGHRTYLVMEFVPGSDLRERIRLGPIEPAEVASIGSEIADALACIHDRGIVHRDLKPANILLADGASSGRMRAKLADFGIARIVGAPGVTMTGMLVGTASYLSPEQAVGAEVTGATDVYALGLVLLECITGERAFPGTGAESMLVRVASDPRIPGWLGPEWGSLLGAMTARDPGERLTAAEAARLLEQASAFTLVARDDDGEPTQAASPPDADVPASDATGGTRVLPVAATATTRLLADAPSDSTRVLTEAAPRPTGAGDRPARRGRRRAAVVVASAAAAAVIAVGLIWLGPALTPAPTSAPPAYPAVSGTLGAHLTQLQEAVAP